jgi:hypothetical protein
VIFTAEKDEKLSNPLKVIAAGTIFASEINSDIVRPVAEIG